MAEAEDISTSGAANSGIGAAQSSFDLRAIPGVRQAGLLLGLALAVSAGVAVALWSQSPTMRVLFPSVDAAEMNSIVGVLDSTAIDYKLDPASGALLVDSSRLQEAQILLAGQGLPRSKGVSLDALYEGVGYSTSQFMESKFYTHALERKLADVVSGLTTVKSAEVTLGLPKQSAFVRTRKEPTASVVVQLFPGRSLEQGQVKAIVHLVASSVPGLNASNVTLLDQNSTMLSGDSNFDALGAANTQLEYKNKLEQSLEDNINALLVPIMGVGRFRTQVVAQLDFSEQEQTTERFDPQSQVVRSEKSQERESNGSSAVSGVPGALTNQPAPRGGEQQDEVSPNSARNTMTDRVLNYEVDRTISRTRATKGKIERLSVAVVLDYQRPLGGLSDEATAESVGSAASETDSEAEAAEESNAVQKVPLSAEQLEEIRLLIQESVGFDENRGDRINLINSRFQEAPVPDQVEEPPLWEQAWVIEMSKIPVAALVILIIALRVLRPLVMGLIESHKVQVAVGAAAAAAPAIAGSDRISADASGQGALPSPSDFKDPLKLAKELATTDPKKIAQVVKEWVAAGE